MMKGEISSKNYLRNSPQTKTKRHIGEDESPSPDSYRLRDAHNLIDEADLDDGGHSGSLKKKTENSRIKTDQEIGEFQRIATFNNEVNLGTSYANNSSQLIMQESMPTTYSPSKGSPEIMKQKSQMNQLETDLVNYLKSMATKKQNSMVGRQDEMRMAGATWNNIQSKAVTFLKNQLIPNIQKKQTMLTQVGTSPPMGDSQLVSESVSPLPLDRNLKNRSPQQSMYLKSSKPPLSKSTDYHKHKTQLSGHLHHQLSNKFRPNQFQATMNSRQQAQALGGSTSVQSSMRATKKARAAVHKLNMVRNLSAFGPKGNSPMYKLKHSKEFMKKQRATNNSSNFIASAENSIASSIELSAMTRSKNDSLLDKGGNSNHIKELETEVERLKKIIRKLRKDQINDFGSSEQSQKSPPKPGSSQPTNYMSNDNAFAPVVNIGLVQNFNSMGIPQSYSQGAFRPASGFNNKRMRQRRLRELRNQGLYGTNLGSEAHYDMMGIDHKREVPKKKRPMTTQNREQASFFSGSRRGFSAVHRDHVQIEDFKQEQTRSGSPDLNDILAASRPESMYPLNVHPAPQINMHIAEGQTETEEGGIKMQIQSDGSAEKPMFMDDMSSVQNANQPMAMSKAKEEDVTSSVEKIRSHEDLLRNRPPFRPPHKPVSRDAVENLGMYFTSKEIKLMKEAMGAQSKEELVQRLQDPQKKFKPTTNMNKSGNMTALRLTYKDSKQYAMGATRNREIKSAYSRAAGSKAHNVGVAKTGPSTYVNYPNKSSEILRKKQNPQSKILSQACDPRVKTSINGLVGSLKTQMDNIHIFNSTTAINQIKKHNPEMALDSLIEEEDQLSGNLSDQVMSSPKSINSNMDLKDIGVMNLASSENEGTNTKSSQHLQGKIMARPGYQNKETSGGGFGEHRKAANVLYKPKHTPITGRGHILLQYEPYLEKKKDFEFIHMGNMEFFHRDQKIHINKEHYYPSFIAKNVDELRDNRNTRKMLKKYRIFSEFKEEEENEEDARNSAGGGSQESISKKSTHTYERKGTRSVEKRSRHAEGTTPKHGSTPKNIGVISSAGGFHHSQFQGPGAPANIQVFSSLSDPKKFMGRTPIYQGTMTGGSQTRGGTKVPSPFHGRAPGQGTSLKSQKSNISGPSTDDKSDFRYSKEPWYKRQQQEIKIVKVSRQSPQMTAEKIQPVVGLDSAPKKKETMRVPPSGDMDSSMKKLTDTVGKAAKETNREQIPIPGISAGALKNPSMSQLLPPDKRKAMQAPADSPKNIQSEFSFAGGIHAGAGQVTDRSRQNKEFSTLQNVQDSLSGRRQENGETPVTKPPQVAELGVTQIQSVSNKESTQDLIPGMGDGLRAGESSLIRKPSVMISSRQPIQRKASKRGHEK